MPAGKHQCRREQGGIDKEDDADRNADGRRRRKLASHHRPAARGQCVDRYARQPEAAAVKKPDKPGKEHGIDDGRGQCDAGGAHARDCQPAEADAEAEDVLVPAFRNSVTRLSVRNQRLLPVAMTPLRTGI